jgi:hypothetical protein
MTWEEIRAKYLKNPKLTRAERKSLRKIIKMIRKSTGDIPDPLNKDQLVQALYAIRHKWRKEIKQAWLNKNECAFLVVNSREEIFILLEKRCKTSRQNKSETESIPMSPMSEAIRSETKKKPV